MERCVCVPHVTVSWIKLLLMFCVQRLRYTNPFCPGQCRTLRVSLELAVRCKSWERAASLFIPVS